MKQVFQVKIDGKDVNIAVKRPSLKLMDEGNIVYNKVFSQMLKAGGILRAKLHNVLREQNIWNDEKQSELDEIDKKIADFETKLSKGGAIGLTKLKGREIAIQLLKERLKRLTLLSETNSLDNQTIESQAENRRFDYFVSTCTYYDDTGELCFKDLEDYLTKSNGGDPISRDAATKLAAILYGYDPDFQSKLPENQFLLKYKFVNKDLQFIDKDGNLCDESFRKIDKDGFLINDAGKRVDNDGNEIDENGNLVVEFKEFLDD